MATAMARRCIEALDANRQDYTMLWLLKRVEWLEQCKAGRELTDWARNRMEVPMTIASGEEFQAEVSREFKSRGIKPVAPERVVDNWSKDKAKQMCLDAKWPKPYFPVMLQTRPGPKQKGGAFIMFSSWQDAMFALQRMAGTGLYRGREREYGAEMVYENQIVDMAGYDYPCRLILDCDAKISEHGEGHTVESLTRLIEEVPQWFVKRLVQIGAIKSTDRVVVYEKEKSRENKASRHYIFNIMGFSTWDTQAVLREIFGAEQQKERERESKKSKAVALPVWKMVDTVPHHGRGQYSVLGFFDRNKKETEYPCITRRLEILNGEVMSSKPCKVSRAESGLDHPLALVMLHRTCYSSQVADFVTLDRKFMVQRTVIFISWPAVRIELTLAPDHGAGKNRVGAPKFVYQARWTRRGPHQPRSLRREAGLPAAVGPISDFQDHWQEWRVRCQHEHEVSGCGVQHAEGSCRQGSTRGCGPHITRPILPQLGVQGDLQGARKKWDIRGARGRRRCPVCSMRRQDMLVRRQGTSRRSLLGGGGGKLWRSTPMDQAHGRHIGRI